MLTDKLNHLLIIPDGCRRHAKRQYLMDLFRKSIEEFRSALQRFPEKDILALKARIEYYANTGNDSFYYGEDFDDFFDSGEILIPKNYLLNSYRKGGEVFTSLIRWILQNNVIKVLSIYALQKRNLDRSNEQTYVMLKSELEVFRRWVNDKTITSQCKFKFVGDKKVFDLHRNRHFLGEVIEEYLNNSRELEEKSSGRKLKIYILTPYDRIWEINQAVVNNKFDPARLVVKEEVDLIIRTGYAKTPTSGALPYQTAYSQFSSVREYFEDFTIEKFQKVLKGYRGKRESGL